MALRGIKVLEMAGLAPGPFCGMILSDFGASVTRIDRVNDETNMDCLSNGKKSIALNIKSKKGTEIFHRLCKKSDVLIDTYRAGVMESLGLGPDVLQKENPTLIYARLSGFGQTGYMSKRAGHDINYVALSGILSSLGRADEKPTAPINLLADFAGGGLTCALGIVMALFERSSSGMGQVVDCSMVEGAAYLGSWLYRSQILPIWNNKRGENLLDGGAHFYDTYKTKDGKYMSVGALEYKFYQKLLEGLGFSEDEVPQFEDIEEGKKKFTSKFLEKTREEWCEVFDNIDACVTPVLTLEEASKHQHNIMSESFAPCRDQKKMFPAPAPKLSRTPALSFSGKSIIKIGQHTEQILRDFNYSDKEISVMENEAIVKILRQSKI